MPLFIRSTDKQKTVRNAALMKIIYNLSIVPMAVPPWCVASWVPCPYMTCRLYKQINLTDEMFLYCYTRSNTNTHCCRELCIGKQASLCLSGPLASNDREVHAWCFPELPRTKPKMAIFGIAELGGRVGHCSPSSTILLGINYHKGQFP